MYDNYYKHFIWFKKWKKRKIFKKSIDLENWILFVEKVLGFSQIKVNVKRLQMIPKDGVLFTKILFTATRVSAFFIHSIQEKAILCALHFVFLIKITKKWILNSKLGINWRLNLV